MNTIVCASEWGYEHLVIALIRKKFFFFLCEHGFAIHRDENMFSGTIGILVKHHPLGYDGKILCLAHTFRHHAMMVGT